MSASTSAPAIRRLCALATPLPLVPAASLAKGANRNDPQRELDSESPYTSSATWPPRFPSLKRRRDEPEAAVEPRRIIGTNARLDSPTRPRSGRELHKKSPALPVHDVRVDHGPSERVRRSSTVSPTPRSAPSPSPGRARSTVPPRPRSRILLSRPAVPSSSRVPPQTRRLSTSPAQRKPALAYHDLVSNALESTTKAVTPETPTVRATSTAAAAVQGDRPATAPNEKADDGTLARVANLTNRKACLPPRPASPYGEINELARHPTLYDPIRKPRHPIVLCHGLYGFDVRGPGFFRLHYWGDMLKILRGKIGAEVYVTAVPGTGSVKKRANVLHKSLEDTPSLLNRDINFVAHSMGGLDARYLISQIQPTLYHPRSLTTICTPHRGSEFMAWCRANIGIGTDLESNEAVASQLRPCNSSSLDDPDDTSIPLPLTLKSPILSREQVEAAKRATKAAKEAAARGDKFQETTKFPGLPFNLSTTVTSYLLNLLDSPAYANLTPTFLRDVFNPTTPNMPDVKYYSIAGRTDKIPIWHPLWLPKLVLDGAEQARISQGAAAPPEWRGNDGLVNVDSARWGEFLGTFDGADHWEMRGSSGLISAEASKHAIDEIARSEFRKTSEPVQGEKAERVHGGIEDQKDGEGSSESSQLPRKPEKDRGWQWQDVYALIGKLKGGNGKKNGSNGTKSSDVPPTPASTSNRIPDGAEAAVLRAGSSGPDPAAPTRRPSIEPKSEDSADAKGLKSAADWIVSQLPGSAPSAATKAAGEIATKAGTVASSVATSAATSAQSAASSVADSVLANPATRLLYGAPGSSASSSSSSDSSSRANRAAPPSKPDRFSLEHMTVALCRKLYNDGL